MVQSKKICCLILACAFLVAVGALCALGVKADSWGGTVYTPSNYQVYCLVNSYGSTLPLTIRNISNQPSFFWVACQGNGSKYYHLEFTFNFNSFVLLDSSKFVPQENNNPVDSSVLTYVELIPTTVGYTVVCNLAFSSATSRMVGLRYTPLTESLQLWASLTLSSVYAESSDTPFEDPYVRPDDTDFQPLELGSYFTNYKNSNFSTWYQPNQVSNELPFRRYLYNMSSGFDFYCGALVPDWTDVLLDNVVLKGSCEVVVADTQGYIVSDDSKFSLARPYFVNQTDPSTTGFEYAVVPSTWDTTITYTKVPVNTFGFKFIVNFYIVIPSTWQTDLSFIPSDIVVLFGGFANSNVDDFIVLFNSYELSYYYRQSSSSPLPDNPNGGFPDEVITPTPVEQISDQQTWINGQVDSYDDDYSDIVNQINDILAGIDAQFYGSGLNSLYNAMSYSGTDFSFTLPATTIPFPDSSHTLTLWGEQTIPFKQYIDNLPSQYKLIIGYLVLLSSASVTFGCFYIHYLRLIRGNVVVK